MKQTKLARREKKTERRMTEQEYRKLRRLQDEIYHRMCESLIRIVIKDDIKESQPLSKAMTRLLKAYLRVELTGLKEEYDAGFAAPYRYTNVIGE